MTQRRLLLLIGPDLAESRRVARPVINRLRTDLSDGLALSLVNSENNAQYEEQFLTAMRAAVQRGEQPVVYLDAHGLTAPDGRHNVYFNVDDSMDFEIVPMSWQPGGQDTAQMVTRIVTEYRNAYQQTHGADALPPRLMLAISACYSEGVMRDLPSEVLQQADILVGDSEAEKTWQADSGKTLTDLSLGGSGEEIFIRELLGDRPNARNTEPNTVPALATAQGVIDGDALRDRVTAENFQATMAAARANVERIPASLQSEASRELDRLSPATLNSIRYERARALAGYLAHYDERFTPLEHYHRQGELIRQFREPGQSAEELRSIYAAIEENNRPIVLGFPSAEFDHPNQGNEQGDTALMHAASAGNLNLARLLLANGAQINLPGRHGITPLGFAATEPMAEFLIGQGADVNQTDRWGNTMLQMAATEGNEARVRLLLQQQANIDAGAFTTPLIDAARANHPEIVQLLREKGAEYRAFDTNGDDFLSPQEAQAAHDAGFTRFVAQHIEGKLPPTIDGIYDTSGDGVATVEEVAAQLARGNVTMIHLDDPEELLGEINRVAEQLRAESPQPTTSTVPTLITSRQL